MPTYRLGLLFQSSRKTDLPGPPTAHVYIKHHTTERVRDTKGDALLITTRALSFKAFRENLNSLRRELDEIEKDAKRKFATDDGGLKREPKKRTYRDIVGKLP